MGNKEFIFLKPDAIEGKFVGKIINRLEESGFSIVNMRKGKISQELALQLYPDTESQLTGMGNKTIKAMTEKNEADKIQPLFGANDALGIGKTLNMWNRAYATSTEVIAMILEKPSAADAPTEVRTLLGSTDPARAEKGTIRGDYSNDTIYDANLGKRAVKNLMHASDVDRVDVEMKLFEEQFFNK